MTDDAELPKGEITIWRGVNDPDDGRGISWTRDKDKAAWFAKRFARLNGKDKTPAVFEATVFPENVLACFDGRGEQEVVVDPRGLRNLRRIE